MNSLFHHNESKHSKLFEELSGQPEESYEYYRMTPETHSQYTVIKIKNAAHVFTDFFFSTDKHISQKMPVTYRNERTRHCIQTAEHYVNTQCCICIRSLCFCLEKCLYVLLLFVGIYLFLCKSVNFSRSPSWLMVLFHIYFDNRIKCLEGKDANILM